ncbi:MAG TPA: 8-amino-7-oxononanoate synthase [Acidimicrobiia bacterium]|nr:8-amino-7-oxononanoate synthase [Acidimicrobiia bacterium]
MNAGPIPGGAVAADPLAFCGEELARLEATGLRRRVRALESASEPEVVLDGRRVLCLASNNYLGLAAHPEVVDAAAEAARRYGAGAGSARLVTGGLVLHDELEARLAAFKGTDDAVLFSSGYLANLGTVAALVGPGDAVFSDVLNHASIIDGCRLSRADVHVYRHADAGHLADRLGAWRREAGAGARALVVTDSVFSMDGDVAPLPDIAAACERHGAVLMVDEAHATGVVGPGGRGAVAGYGLEGRVGVVMGTLSKALGAAGGFIAGSGDLCAYLRNRARSFIFDTALPPPTAAAALAALGIVEQEPERPVRARRLAGRLAAGLRSAGYDVADPPAAVLPVVVGAPDAALRLSARLLDAGVLVTAIRPPSVPEGTSRLRATVMATHTDAEIDRAVAAFAAARRDPVMGADRG